jgi:membrane protein
MANPVSWTLEQIRRLNEVIWHTPLSEISKGKIFLLKQLRIIVLAARGFTRNRVQLRASALTYYTLLSVIPVVAIAFAIAKGFGLDQILKDLIVREFSSQKEVLDWLLQFATSALEAARGGPIAGIGMILLFYSVMAMLNRIESSFNHIWQIRSSRPWYRKFTDYLTIMLISPVFIILSGSLTLFISTKLQGYMESAPILEFFKPLISFLVKFSPYFLTWIALVILYIIMPNTKVNFVPALISGIISGTIIQLLQWVYIDLQFGITKLNAIYGSFAAVPLFILWMQLNWITILLGAELTFANQNVSRYEDESEALNISNFQKRALMIMILHRIISNFSVGEKPISAENVAKSLKIPVRLARDILQDLSNSNIVSIVHEHEHKEQLFQPALDINKLTISYVFTRLDKKGFEQVMVTKNKDYDKVMAILERFDRLIAKSDSNILIKDL